MNRRERLLASVIGPELDATKAKMLDATIKLILGDMGQHYLQLWDSKEPSVAPAKSLTQFTLEPQTPA